MVSSILVLALLLQSGPVWLPLITIGSSSPAATSTSTATAMPSRTATATQTPTWTSTPTRTHTPTATATRTPTSTATPSPTPTWTPGATATIAAGYLTIGHLRCDSTDEYVRIDNIGGVAADLADWRLLSVVGPQTFYFPSYQLDPGASVYVHSGPGAPPTSGNNLYWTNAYIWNNSNDQAQLINPDGAVVSQRNC